MPRRRPPRVAHKLGSRVDRHEEVSPAPGSRILSSFGGWMLSTVARTQWGRRLAGQGPPRPQWARPGHGGGQRSCDQKMGFGLDCRWTEIFWESVSPTEPFSGTARHQVPPGPPRPWGDCHFPTVCQSTVELGQSRKVRHPVGQVVTGARSAGSAARRARPRTT